MRLGRIIILLCMPLLIITGSAQEEQPKPSENIDIVSDSVLNDINNLIKDKQWVDLVNYYKHMVEGSNSNILLKKLYPDPEPGSKNYVSFSEFVIKRFSKLPKEFLQGFRPTFDLNLTREFIKPREQWDIRLIDKLIDLYFFSSHSDEAMEMLANFYMERGNIRRAITHFKNLLNYPDPDVSIPNAIAGLALCYKLLGKAELVAGLKRYKEYLSQNISTNNQTLTLEKYIDNIYKETKTQPKDVSVDAKFLALPDGKQITNSSYYHSSRITGTIHTQFPIMPAFYSLDGKQYIIVQDGEDLQTVELLTGKPALKVGPENTQLKNPVPPPRNKDPIWSLYSRFGAFVTCQATDDFILANMYSPKLRIGKIFESSLRRPLRNPAPLNSLRAFDRKNLTLLFSTDEIIEKEREKIKKEEKEKIKTAAEFARGNCSFSLPVMFQDNMFYVGITAWTDSISNQTSYVACFELDNKKIKLTWWTQLSTKFSPEKKFYKRVPHLSLSAIFLTEKDGIIYACTNTGTIAALDSYTGKIIWLNSYQTPQNDFARIANYPILHKDHIFLLPMDYDEMIIIDTESGKRIDPFKLSIASSTVEWSGITHLQGILKGPEHDFMILSGSEGTFVIKLDSKNLSKSQRVTTIPAKTAMEQDEEVKTIAGHGAIIGNMLFIPFVEQNDGKAEEGIKVIKAGPWKSPSGSWTIAQIYNFSGKKQYGNLLLVENKIIISTEESLIIYH